MSTKIDWLKLYWPTQSKYRCEFIPVRCNYWINFYTRNYNVNNFTSTVVIIRSNTWVTFTNTLWVQMLDLWNFLMECVKLAPRANKLTHTYVPMYVRPRQRKHDGNSVCIPMQHLICRCQHINTCRRTHKTIV